MNRDDLEAQPAVDANEGQSDASESSEGSNNVVSLNSNSDTMKTTFDASLEQLRIHTEGGKTSARLCADIAIQHFAMCGDLIYAQRLVDFMTGSVGKNYSRPAAFVKWMVDFSPAKYEGGKFTKDKLREQKMWPDSVAKQDLIDKALATPFWDHKPDTELQQFGRLDILNAVLKTLKKFENENRYSAASEAAEETRKEMMNYVNSLIETKKANAA